MKLNFITSHIINNILPWINSKGTKIVGGKKKWMHKCQLPRASIKASLKSVLFVLALKHKRRIQPHFVNEIIDSVRWPAGFTQWLKILKTKLRNLVCYMRLNLETLVKWSSSLQAGWDFSIDPYSIEKLRLYAFCFNITGSILPNLA